MKKAIAVLLMTLAAPATAEVEVNCYRYDGIDRELCLNQNAQIELENSIKELQQKQEELLRNQNELLREQEERMLGMDKDSQRYRN